jgi:hypothetical protein
LKSNKISLKCIHDLLGLHFIIPPFQRGFRWTSLQVTDLLDDIWEFTQKNQKPKEEFYCLQPIVVAPHENRYIVIDGQQRLTAIFIIMAVLKDIKELIIKENFSLKYETRKTSEKFLQNILVNRKDENIDYYYICEAFETIENWFDNKPGPVKLNFLNTLLGDDVSGNNVKVIWYEVLEETDPIDIFTRINMGKIPLTNAELVKALFLREINFKGNSDFRRLRQLEIAAEWDNIERNLRNEEFWYFITDGKKSYANHIEFLFDLIAQTPSNAIDNYSTFRYFNERIGASDDISKSWKEIKNYYLTFNEWFENRTYYHLIGCLITFGMGIEVIKNKCSLISKTNFESYLKRKIRDYVNCKIDELNYFQDKIMIKKVLLLFNIITLISKEDSNARFQFNRFKKENWDLEHIHSVQSNAPKSPIHQKEWLSEVMQFTDDNALKNRINLFLDNHDNDEFEILYNEILETYNEDGFHEDVNDISNLALLDAGTNRGYKNAVFPIKRKIIIEKDMYGKFIPLCTKNVFLKYYSDKIDQMTFWGKTDQKSYLKTINRVIFSYFDDNMTESNEE